MTCKALIVSSNAQLVGEITDALDSLGHKWETACSQQEALERLKAGTFDYLLSDIGIPARAQNGNARIQNTENMLDQLGGVKLKHQPPVILMSDYAANGVEETVDVMRLAISMHGRGVVDIIAKPLAGKGRTLDRVIKKVLAGKVERVKITLPEPVPTEAQPPAEPAKPTPAPAPAEPCQSAASEAATDKWLTVTQAAELLARDLGLDIKKARSRVSTAAGRKEFKFAGERKDRRIEPNSFAAWRLKQRDRDLDEEDAGES